MMGYLNFLSLTLLSVLHTESYAFTASGGIKAPSSTQLALVDPVMIGVAAASAAAGAASQVPKIQELERELEIAQASLSESEMEVANKMKALEDKLFNMDKEYEMQTDRFKKQYDQKMQIQLSETQAKIKQDFEFRLGIKMEEQKAEMLKEKFEFVNSLTGDKQQELVDLRLQQGRIQEMNAKLEVALKDSEDELKRLRAGPVKRGWWPF